MMATQAELQTRAAVTLLRRHHIEPPDTDLLADAAVPAFLLGRVANVAVTQSGRLGAWVVSITEGKEVTTYRVSPTGTIQVPNPDASQAPDGPPDWVPEESIDRKGRVA